MDTERAVLVTGAGRGIGEGIARVLADAGWTVGVNDLDGDAAAAMAEVTGGVAVVGDVRDAPALVDRAVTELGRLDGLVNNAGIHRRAALADVSDEAIDDVWAVDLRAVVRLSREALPHLQATGGAIVSVSSIAAHTPQMQVGLYTAAKAGVEGFTRQAAVEWGPRGVRVNAVAPGMVRTEMAEAVYADEDLYERRRSMVPLRRIGRPEDIGRAVAWLLGPDSDYVTGQSIVVDGGFTRVLVDLLPHPPAG